VEDDVDLRAREKEEDDWCVGGNASEDVVVGVWWVEFRALASKVKIRRACSCSGEDMGDPAA
jgi:hypothetical protein